MNVWVVLKYDVESSEIIGIFSDEKKANVAILEARDEQVDEWELAIKVFRDRHSKNTYLEMIANLTVGDDWKKWENYPHTNFRIEKYVVE